MVQYEEKEADGVRAVVMMEEINEVLSVGTNRVGVISVAKGMLQAGLSRTRQC